MKNNKNLMNAIFSLKRFCVAGKLMLVICMMWCTNVLYAQIVEEPQVTGLMDRWINYNIEHQELRGWRIQLLASVDRRQAESVKRKFEANYKENPLMFVHNNPYFHLKVGAFMTMQRAQAFLYQMQKDYPQAIIVTDHLLMDELLLYDQ